MTFIPQHYDVEMYEILHSIMSKLNRRGYVPLEPGQYEKAVAAGYVKNVQHRAKFTQAGYDAYADLSRSHREWELAEGNAADAAGENMESNPRELRNVDLWVYYKIRGTFGYTDEKDETIRATVKKYSPRAKESGSGSGFGERDISFYNMTEPEARKAANALARKGFRAKAARIDRRGETTMLNPPDGGIHIDIDSHKGEPLHENPPRIVYRIGEGRTGPLVKVYWDSDYREYEVLTERQQHGEGYFTADKDDAIATAKEIAKNDGYEENAGAKMRQSVYNWITAVSAARRFRGQWFGNNTKIRFVSGDAETDGEDQAVAIILHHTPIVTYHADDTVELNSGGFLTSTTKARMNEVLPPSIRVYQQRHEWFVGTPQGEMEFVDRMRIPVA